MCPQGHPHQLEPILLKHFPMVIKAKAERKTRGKVAKLYENQIRNAIGDDRFYMQ